MNKESNNGLITYFVLNNVLYGAETWALRHIRKTKLDICEKWIWLVFGNSQWRM